MDLILFVPTKHTLLFRMKFIYVSNSRLFSTFSVLSKKWCGVITIFYGEVTEENIRLNCNGFYIGRLCMFIVLCECWKVFFSNYRNVYASWSWNKCIIRNKTIDFRWGKWKVAKKLRFCGSQARFLQIVAKIRLIAFMIQIK